ncbi:MAG TPA: helix-turn-helix domain-containing protein [Candidatus Saccharimonadales bacterium]|nr:helix-turn-helix domain-containing protein [Candidatus Saccharimonadales bacterium]
MSDDISPIHEYFAKLGLEPEVADVYLALHAYGRQSLLQLARNARIERTRLYRLLDTLTDYNLIEIETEYKRRIYRAAPIGNLQVLLTKREQEIRDLQQELVRLQDAYQPAAVHSPLTHVQFYRGPDGVKQMLWNQTKSTSEVLSILYENMQTRTNLVFFERWVERCNERDIKFRSIAGDHFLLSQRRWYGNHDNEKLKFWEGRYIPQSIFPITHSTLIYDDVVAYFNWRDGEVFGVEVYNQEIADAMRQFFEMLWRQGQPIPGHGETPPETVHQRSKS